MHPRTYLTRTHRMWILVWISSTESRAAMTTILGLLAGLLTTGCWLPQLVHSWRTRSTADISWLYLGALTGGVTLWVVYGVLTADLVIIVANVATSAALASLVAFKVVFDRPVQLRRRGWLPAQRGPSSPASITVRDNAD